MRMLMLYVCGVLYVCTMLCVSFLFHVIGHAMSNVCVCLRVCMCVYVCVCYVLCAYVWGGGTFHYSTFFEFFIRFSMIFIDFH